jgi:hypothetical protein
MTGPSCQPLEHPRRGGSGCPNFSAPSTAWRRTCFPSRKIWACPRLRRGRALRSYVLGLRPPGIPLRSLTRPTQPGKTGPGEPPPTDRSPGPRPFRSELSPVSARRRPSPPPAGNSGAQDCQDLRAAALPDSTSWTGIQPFSPLPVQVPPRLTAEIVESNREEIQDRPDRDPALARRPVPARLFPRDPPTALPCPTATEERRGWGQGGVLGELMAASPLRGVDRSDHGSG